MPTVRSFNDTSSVSLAYAISDKDARADFAAGNAPAMNLVPFTTEQFTMQKEAQSSTAIRGDRRTTGSKNTRGSANGGLTVEFGSNQWILDMLSLILLNDWKDVDDADPAQGKYLVDGEVKKYAVWEKTIRQGKAATDRLDHEVFYGTIVNDATLEFGDAALITMAINTISSFADYTSALAGAQGLGGSLAASKATPADYEIADSSNNLSNIELYNADDELMECVFSDASLELQNNAREQTGLSYEFAAGIGIGKVAASLSGTIYYYDNTMLDAHMLNKRMRAQLTISTAEGTFLIQLPNLMAQTPTSNAEGENQDFTTEITFTAEAGSVDIGGTPVPCIIAITHVPTP